MAAAAFFWELFTPRPNFTEKDVADQYGKVFIVTGGASGCGYETAKALYNLNGRVYIAGRSEKNAEVAIAEIRNSPQAADQIVQGGKGELFFLQLDLADLSTIKTSAEEFLSKEDRLDVIWHNAGVMVPPPGSETKQGYDLQFGTNVLGPFLFQHFLTPLCLKTVQMPGVQRNATRVIFVSSVGHHLSPKPDGVNWDDLNMKSMTSASANGMKYGQSKAMNVMHAHELARRYSSQGLVSLSLHPGALRTNLGRSLPWLVNYILTWIHYPAHFGALTELYAGFNEDVDSRMLEDGGRNGAYILPWGRFGDGSPRVFDGLTQRKTGEKLWSVCEELLKEYL
ncbi:MAG: hypothetical protein M1836_002511 [Candelina mexicana]|nr:MAG: hypothetical protein M1836_002511 [Candelina mexicana]